ncbi:MAG: carotenoid biosynthesis protein [Candidatus Thorarchaeota archaeon]
MADYDPLFLEKLFAFVKYLDSFGLWSTFEICGYVLAALLVYHGYRKYGRTRIILYFLGALLLTGLEENFMVIQGFFHVFGGPTYYYNFHMYMFWIAAVPLVVPCAWFILAYSTFQIAGMVVSKNSSRALLKKLALAGWMGTSIDFVIDPIIIRYWSWIWLNDKPWAVWFLQVPVTNFIGFFLLVVAFNYYYVWFWEKYAPRHQKWSPKRTTATYFVMVLLPLLAVIGIIILLSILFTPLKGIDFSWWEWPS